MNQREKMLAAMVVLLIALFAAYRWYGNYRDTLADRRAAIHDANARLADVNLALAEGRRAVEQLETWQEQSLPDNREKALSLYKAWLLDKATAAGLHVADIKPSPRTSTSAAYSTIGYQMEASGTLSEVVGVLYEFYRSPILHQVTRLQLNKPSGGSGLKMTMDVEGLSLPGATATDRLPEGDSQRLQLASLEAYQKRLGERDLLAVYTPPRPPRAETAVRPTPPPPKFDDAEHAHFTGTVGPITGLQAWITVRTTGETLFVAAGDPIKVGLFEGEVVSIEPRLLVLKAGEKRIRIPLGQSIRDGKELEADAAAASDEAISERRSSPPG
jgi:hypothetical protein